MGERGHRPAHRRGTAYTSAIEHHDGTNIDIFVVDKINDVIDRASPFTPQEDRVDARTFGLLF